MRVTVDVSFLIVNYNGGRFIEKCIESIYTWADEFQIEVVVVDNHSIDHSVETIERQYPNVILHKNQSNEGFSKGMNQAYRLSTGKYIFSFNPDAELTENCISILVKHMDNNPDIGKLATAAIQSDGSIAYPVTEFRAFHNFMFLDIIKRKFFHTSKTPVDNTPRNVQWLFGTGIMIRRSALASDFIYPEKSFLFWEEYWLSKSILEKGYRIETLPEAKIVHHSGVTFKTNKRKLQMARLLSLSHEYLIRKSHFGGLNAIGNLFIMVVDYSILCLAFAPKLLWKKNDIDLQNTVNDYHARLRAAFLVLMNSESGLRRIDDQAKAFFNQ